MAAPASVGTGGRPGRSVYWNEKSIIPTDGYLLDVHMVTVFALTAAILYGSADFLGGAASRRSNVLAVLAVSVTTGTIVATAAALLAGGPPRAAGIAWGAAAGIAGGIGFMVFYAGLAAGPMGVVAPVSALVSTVLPVAAAVAAGERPGPRVYAGALACVAAIVLVSWDGGAGGLHSGRAAARGIGYGVASGVAFGMFFLFIRNGGESGGLWPVAAARLAGTLIVVVAAAATRTGPVGWRPDGRTFLAAVGAGMADSSANVCYALATQAGLFGVAVVLTSLYPGVTVLLARFVLGERMGWLRQAGLVLAVSGIALVTV
jgi:drug/metabolite transporter (DMT)-like permease